MPPEPAPTALFRLAAPADAGVVARLLQAFNDEYAVPTPGVAVLEERLAAHLASGDLVAVLAEPEQPSGSPTAERGDAASGNAVGVARCSARGRASGTPARSRSSTSCT